jgi:transcriptional/translational regulatory protein YebC/TACO1
MFDRRGYFAIERQEMGEEAFMELALELGADDLSVDGELYEIYTSPEDYTQVKEALEERGVELAAKELAMVPQSYVDVEPDNVSTLMNLVEALEDHDDVQNVWANAELGEDEELAEAS